MALAREDVDGESVPVTVTERVFDMVDEFVAAELALAHGEAERLDDTERD